MNTEAFYTLMAFFAKRHSEGIMPEYEIQAYEGMCRGVSALTIMQEALFRKETKRLNDELDGDTSADTRKTA